MPDQDVTTVHLKDGTTLHLKGANLSPEMVTQKVSAFRATQQPQRPTPESQRPDATKQAQSVIQGIPKGPALGEFLDSSQGKEMQKSNVDAGKFGADMLAGGEVMKAGKAFFSPTTITKAGPLVPGGRDAATGRMLPWIESQVTGKGPSLARQGVSGVVSGAKGAAAWLKANPVKALVLEGIARQMGIDPIQLVSKVIKLGGDGK